MVTGRAFDRQISPIKSGPRPIVTAQGRIRGRMPTVLPSSAIGQGALWDRHNEAGLEAREQARYAEADKQLMIALEEAQGFRREDPRPAATLSNLANV